MEPMPDAVRMRRRRELKLSVTILIAVTIIGFVVIDWNFFYGIIESHRARSSSQAIEHVSVPVTAPANILTIPSLGITAPVNYPTDAASSTIETSLQTGVAHYPGTALPGQIGDVYIFGHSSDFIWSPGSYKHVFTSLPRIAIGSQILLSDSSGNTYTYTVTSKKVISSQDLSVLQQDLSKHQLILQTSYPLGTALERYVVFAQLDR